MTYSTLEFNLGQIIEALLSCNAAARRAIVDATGASIQSRCQLILKFASINSPSIKWFETMDYWLSNVIVKEISPRRNRLVHDVWLSGAGMARQWDLRVSLSKSQSRREKTLSDPKLSKIELESTWLFVRDIKEAAVVIFTIHLDYVVWKSTGQLPELHERFHPQNMRRVAKPRSLQEP